MGKILWIWQNRFSDRQQKILTDIDIDYLWFYSEWHFSVAEICLLVFEKDCYHQNRNALDFPSAFFVLSSSTKRVLISVLEPFAKPRRVDPPIIVLSKFWWSDYGWGPIPLIRDTYPSYEGYLKLKYKIVLHLTGSGCHRGKILSHPVSTNDSWILRPKKS